MHMKLNTKQIQRLLIIIYVALVVLFQGYSNTYELILSFTLLIINLSIVLPNGRLDAKIARVMVGCFVLSMWVLLSIVLGQSSGNVGPLYMQVEFLICLFNIIVVDSSNELNNRRTIAKYINVITALSLAYNIYMYIIHPEYRTNLYLNTIEKGRFIGGVTFSMYIGFFLIIQLYTIITCKNRLTRLNIILRVALSAACIYYIMVCNPSATVIIVTLVCSIITIIGAKYSNDTNKRRKLIIIFTSIILVPLVLFLVLNYAIRHMDQSSRLYDRFKAIISALGTPSSLLSNTYFSRFSMLIDEIKLTFSSLNNMLVGTGYNFSSFTSVSQQMSILGIGYHSSMIDWFPTYGLISGTILWVTIANVRKYLEHNHNSILVSNLWIAFVVYCFLNSGFSSMLLLTAILLPALHDEPQLMEE